MSLKKILAAALLCLYGPAAAADFSELAVKAGGIAQAACAVKAAAAQPELARALGILSRGGAITGADAAFMNAWFPKFLAAGQIGRAPTEFERKKVENWFPKLKGRDHWRVTGEACEAYSCVSWAVGVTDEWLWPGDEREDFEAFFPGYGYLQVPFDAPESAGEIAYFEGPVGPTHASRRVAGEIWESKLGSSLRILHTLRDLDGGSYGHVAGFYRKGAPSELAALGIKPIQPSAAAGACPKAAGRGGPYEIGSPFSR